LSVDPHVVLATPWFTVRAEPQPEGEPYYMVALQDYVSVVAVTGARQVLFVRQYRPVVRRQTLELPSGHVEANELPEAAARRELLEETGFVASRLNLLGALVPDVGRMTNRMWCYFADDVVAARAPHQREAGVSLTTVAERDVLRLVMDGTVDHALNLAVLLLAAGSGRLGLW
jgi:8-oxo-dGTP pyrophosphatase MutT (NUDIX family)